MGLFHSLMHVVVFFNRKKHGLNAFRFDPIWNSPALSSVITLKNVITSVQASVLYSHSAAVVPSYSVLFCITDMTHLVSRQSCPEISFDCDSMFSFY